MSRNSKNRIAGQYFVWNLFRRGQTWYADGRGNRPSLGKHSLETGDRTQAISTLRLLDHQKAIDLNCAVPIVHRSISPLTIRQGWLSYLQHAARSEVLGGTCAKTQKRYRAVSDKHQEFCEAKSIKSWDQIDKKTLEQYGAHLKRHGYSDATIYLECTLVKQVIKWLIEEEKCLPEANRIRLRLRRSKESATFCPSREMVSAIIEHCNANVSRDWLADLLLALATTGMRISELVDLRWANVDIEARVLHVQDNRHAARINNASVQTTKGRRSRMIPIHPELLVVLLKRQRDSAFVFVGKKGGRLKPDRVRQSLKAVLLSMKSKRSSVHGESDFDRLRPHGLRHFFVSQAFLSGASEGEIREWVGHADSRILERYRDLRNDDAQRKMASIQFFSQPSQGGTSHKSMDEVA